MLLYSMISHLFDLPADQDHAKTRVSHMSSSTRLVTLLKALTIIVARSDAPVQSTALGGVLYGSKLVLESRAFHSEFDFFQELY